MKKPVSLTVHRNRVEKHQRRERERSMVGIAKKMARDHDLVAFAIVGITKDGQALSQWDTGASLPLWAFPGAVYRILDHDISSCGLEEDFKAPLKP